MTKRRRRVLALSALLVALGWTFLVHPYLAIAAGYAATIGALQHFASGDSIERIRAERLPAQIGFLSLRADEEGRFVEARALYRTSRAVYHGGLGATREETRLVELPRELPGKIAELPNDVPWPNGSSAQTAELAADVDRPRLELALQDAFEQKRGTHALAVVHRGQLVYERYSEGYDRHTPLLGWSMTKSVTVTLVGRLVQEKRLTLDAPVDIEAWQGDARRNIQLNDLLRMRSGLSCYQDHASPFCHSLQMLFGAADAGAFARAHSLEHKVGSTWYYSDATSNIVAGIVLDAVSDDLDERLRVPREWLFEPLGMRTAFISVDGAGNFVGSSLMYASARDWARFGQLYVQDGVWNGVQLLPPDWTDYVSRATEISDDRRYGAHFWRVDTGPIAGVISAEGYQGQFVFIDREREVVLVRLGLAPIPFDGQEFAEAALGAFPQRK